jgi:hypothetical protein
MPITSQAARDADIETKVDAALEQERTARTEEARAVVRARVIEQERIARAAEEQRKIAAARAALIGRAQAVHGPACARYKAAVDEFRAARVQLQALDTIVGAQGFGDIPFGFELCHAAAAPNECDVNDGLQSAVNSIRKTLGG